MDERRHRSWLSKNGRVGSVGVMMVVELGGVVVVSKVCDRVMAIALNFEEA